MKTIVKNQPNFRDLGGVLSKSGQTLKEGLLFRSGSLVKLDEQDFSIIVDLNVKTIVDLRTTQEIDLIGKREYPNYIEYKQIALNAGNIKELLIPIFQKGAFHLLDADIMEKIYLDLITEFKSELAAIYRSFLTADHAVVFHCSHGKDRTGIISALLLDLFGVDRATIYQDYLLSNELLKQSNEVQLQQIKDNFIRLFKREVSAEEFAPVRSLFECREDILNTVFEHVETEYHTIDNYFRTGLGLTESEIELLKLKYLD